MAWGSCTRYYKSRKRGRGTEYPGAKGKTWLMDEALGRAVLRFPVFPENLKKTPKETGTFLIYVWLIHSGFSFHDFFFVWKERGEKKRFLSDFDWESCQASVITRKMVPSADTSGQLHALSWWELSNTVLDSSGNGSPIPEGKKEEDLLLFDWKVGGLGGEQIIS